MHDRVMMARWREHRSAYQALASTLRTAILRNDFVGGVRLPTEAELAAGAAGRFHRLPRRRGLPVT
jgi:DNA-binding GntR family transcriptional regulator